MIGPHRDNGFTVVDPNHPDSTWSVPSQISAAATNGQGQMLTWGVAQNEMGTIPGIGGCEQGPPCDCDCDSVFNQCVIPGSQFVPDLSIPSPKRTHSFPTHSELERKRNVSMTRTA